MKTHNAILVYIYIYDTHAIVILLHVRWSCMHGHSANLDTCLMVRYVAMRSSD